MIARSGQLLYPLSALRMDGSMQLSTVAVPRKLRFLLCDIRPAK
jgi:hypothetical protein